MRFAIATLDRHLGVFEAFVRAGWQPLRLFTTPAGSELSNNRASLAYAEKNDASIQLSRITERDMAELRAQGCDALIVASYKWKIPDWQPYLNFAVNFHPSPLPIGRGAYPVIPAILGRFSRWGVTCHQLTAEFDAGPILAAENFPLRADECHESLDLKTQLAAKKLAAKVAADFTTLWASATPQTDGDYWPKAALSERVVNFAKPLEFVLRHIRAYGETESLAEVGGNWLMVTRAVGWAEVHTYAPGTVIHVFNQTLVIACADGYVAILDHALAPPTVVACMNTSAKAI